MLNHVEIEAGDIRILTPQAQLALANLVRRSSAFAKAGGFYVDVLTVIKAAADAAHVPAVIAVNPASVAAADAAALLAGSTPEDLALVKGLAAVCMKLAGLPGVAVESHGSEKAQRFFSAAINWDELALDVISTLYITPPIVGSAFAVATRKICDGAGQPWLYRSMDELRFSVRRPMYFACGL